MSNQRNITESVKALAAVFGDTNAALAKVLNLSESSAAGKRSGRINWTLADVGALAAHYGVRSEQLLAGPRAWLGLPDHDERATSGYGAGRLPAMAA
jgi:hypothetical protein